MKEPALYHSSRAAAPAVGFSAALLQGLAPDGGLYVPAKWPQLTAPDFEAASDDLPAVAARLLALFLAADPLAAQLTAVAGEAFNFPASLVALEPQGRLSV